MTVLLDTNILVRFVNPLDASHRVVLDALKELRRKGYRPAVIPQVLYEFWVVATRPADQNGLGMEVDDVETELLRCMQTFPLFRDERTVFDHWQQLVVHYGAQGKTAHDARIVAAMQRHRIQHLLNLNVAHFTRFPLIEVTSPKDVATLPQID